VKKSRKTKDRQYNDQKTKGVNKSRKTKDRQYNDQNTKGVIKSRKSQTDNTMTKVPKG
jgi:hypothetical protein